MTWRLEHKTNYHKPNCDIIVGAPNGDDIATSRVDIVIDITACATNDVKGVLNA